MNVKIVDAESKWELENAINTIIENVSASAIADIKFAGLKNPNSSTYYYSAMIIFK